jgi:hypothetical protein
MRLAHGAHGFAGGYGDMTDTSRRPVVLDRRNSGCARQASVIWHQHALAPDYGWGEGLDTFVSLVSGERAA